jgi:hypothetical protein
MAELFYHGSGLEKKGKNEQRSRRRMKATTPLPLLGGLRAVALVILSTAKNLGFTTILILHFAQDDTLKYPAFVLHTCTI